MRPGRPVCGAVLAVLFIGLAGAAPADRWFEDVTARAGVAHKHSNRVFHNPYAAIMAGYTALGAAAAVADYDGDGYEDLFVTDSAENGKIWFALRPPAGASQQRPASIDLDSLLSNSPTIRIGN